MLMVSRARPNARKTTALGQHVNARYACRTRCLQRNIKCFGRLEEVVPRRQGSKSSLHVRTDEGKAVNVAGIDPTESVNVLALWKHDGKTQNVPFSWNTFEIASLVSVLGFHLVRIDLARDIILLDNNSVEVDKGFGDHVQPTV